MREFKVIVKIVLFLALIGVVVDLIIVSAIVIVPIVVVLVAAFLLYRHVYLPRKYRIRDW